MTERISLQAIFNIFWKNGVAFQARRVDPRGCEDLHIMEFRNDMGMMLYDTRTQSVILQRHPVWKHLLETEYNESKSRRITCDA